jgi:hypothetical protein
VNADNVTPIHSGGTPPERPRRRPRERVRLYLKLTHSKEDEGFTTLDVVNGLRGVCRALDLAAVDSSCSDIDHVGDLAMAARVLSEMVGDRVEISLRRRQGDPLPSWRIFRGHG